MRTLIAAAVLLLGFAGTASAQSAPTVTLTQVTATHGFDPVLHHTVTYRLEVVGSPGNWAFIGLLDFDKVAIPQTVAWHDWNLSMTGIDTTTGILLTWGEGVYPYYLQVAVVPWHPVTKLLPNSTVE